MMRSIRKSFIVRKAMILAVLYFLSMATTLAANRIAERKLRDKQARRAQIISAARRIAELEGRSSIGTVLGEPPWYRRAIKNQAISAQPSERAREDARRALQLSKDETAQVVKAR